MKTRTFLSINLPDSIKEKIKREILELKDCYFNFPIKWVSPKNFHLTLYFFGDLSPEKLNLLKELLKQNIKPLKKRINLEIKERSCFPCLQEAKVLFLKVREFEDYLNDLYIKIGQILKKQNFNFTNQLWQPHLTLGRARKNISLNKDFSKTKLQGLKFSIDSLDLMKSKLTKEGPLYTIIENFSI